jgi:RNA ligase (TIGR02306 family)
MSTFKVEVVTLPKFEKHPNADRLFIAKIFDYPVIFNNVNNYREGDLVAYVPVDAVVPMTPEWAFLGESERSHRIKAKKLRGIFSMGLLVNAPEGSKVGDDVTEQLGIIKYEPREPQYMGGENEKDPGFIPCYTDIENYRRYSHILQPDEKVHIFEKVHGANMRFLWHKDRFWLGSRNKIKKEDPKNLWWKAAYQHFLSEKAKRFPGLVFYGEVFGSNVQDLAYGARKNEIFIRCFDVFDINRGIYLSIEEALEFIQNAGLESVPHLYTGPWRPDLVKLAEGKSTIADNVREGFVVRPDKERWSDEVGRVILKVVGQNYLLRKGKRTEYH